MSAVAGGEVRCGYGTAERACYYKKHPFLPGQKLTVLTVQFAR
jgi:hypothetical protein